MQGHVMSAKKIIFAIVLLTCGLNFSDNTRHSWGREDAILTNHQLTNLHKKLIIDVFTILSITIFFDSPKL